MSGYKWRDGFPKPQGVTANAFGKRVAQLGGGTIRGVKAKDVYEDARNPKSPIHGVIDWKATAEHAEAYRVDLIGRYIAALQLTGVMSHTTRTEPRGFESVETEQGRSYVRTPVIQGNEKLRASHYAFVKQEFDNALRRFEGVFGDSNAPSKMPFSDVIAQIRSLADSIHAAAI